MKSAKPSRETPCASWHRVRSPSSSGGGSRKCCSATHRKRSKRKSSVTGELNNDSDADLVDGGGQFRRTQADVHFAGRRRRRLESGPRRYHYRVGKGSHAGKPGKTGHRSEGGDCADAQRAAAPGWHVHPV